MAEMEERREERRMPEEYLKRPLCPECGERRIVAPGLDRCVVCAGIIPERRRRSPHD
jgi:hypothetical protein